ncbi:undecaprenyl diphosphate synthase family protein [Paratissierella segnis]|uniref:Undecaprenyl diphosphate synthase family protein n=1 Tax=Paratissierella segnis TaxID=2763679 RepID=A0A926EVH9_9FIRM|nr:undecaprenyl diphosphate synthase family protein [Paratissierella segnis]MBC8586990.1 undecaprenyl diphosphate synthase family protein [Paratissierella segnis]
MRVPKHIGIIPDGNRRWALTNGLTKEKGYDRGLDPGLHVFKLCERYGIKELTFYGFTVDNTKRPKFQRLAFTRACIDAVEMLSRENAELLVMGNYESPMFPKELFPYIERKKFGSGGVKVNFLVNYDWEWDIESYLKMEEKNDLIGSIKSKDISRVDLIIRWGGRRRLSGFLPLQSVYSDFYIIDEFWPDFTEEQFNKALDWYQIQDITLGG